MYNIKIVLFEDKKMIGLLNKLLTIGLLIVSVHNADAMRQHNPIMSAEDLRITQICRIRPDTTRNQLTGELDISSLTEQGVSPQNALRIRMFDKSFKTRNKYMSIHTTTDTKCMFSTREFEGITIYLVNLLPEFEAYSDNDTVIGSMELLNILSGVLSQANQHFRYTNPRINRFLTDMTNTTPMEILHSCLDYFAVDYGLCWDEIMDLIGFRNNKLNTVINEVNGINFLLNQYRNEQYGKDAEKLNSEIIPYSVLIEKLYGSHPFGNPARNNSSISETTPSLSFPIQITLQTNIATNPNYIPLYLNHPARLQEESFVPQITPEINAVEYSEEIIIPPITDTTLCHVYQMPIERLAQQLKVNIDVIEDIKEQNVVFVQRSDISGPGTRYISSPQLENIKNQIDREAKLLGTAVVDELSRFENDETENISDEALIFITEHSDALRQLGEWSEFLQKHIIPATAHIAQIFTNFGNMENKIYSEVRKIFCGLDVL